jgi:hypothetical protein
VSDWELFHEIADQACARVRLEVVRRGVKELIDFRNVHFERHRERLTELGGEAVPALWDGSRLHVGEEAVTRALGAIIPSS